MHVLLHGEEYQTIIFLRELNVEPTILIVGLDRERLLEMGMILVFF